MGDLKANRRSLAIDPNDGNVEAKGLEITEIKHPGGDVKQLPTDLS